jgi:antirestriction protein ArdC
MNMNRDEALKRSDDALKELAGALREGKSEALLTYLDSMSRFHQYSFGNCLLIAIQRPDATLVAGFHRWKQLGRWVRSGEKGIAILAPLISRRKAIDEEPEEANDSEDANPRKLRGFRVVHVFDISQTEGNDLPKLGDIEGDPGEKLQRVEEMIQEKGIELSYVESLGGALGRSEGGKISVLSTLGLAETFSVLVHELAHELLHRGDRRKETTKVIRETEAEAVAYVVSKAIGLSLSTKSSDYIQLWSGDQDVLMQSLELIREVASHVITELTAPVQKEVACVA